jgi:hypothetical protein
MRYILWDKNGGDKEENKEIWMSNKVGRNTREMKMKHITGFDISVTQCSQRAQWQQMKHIARDRVQILSIQ